MADIEASQFLNGEEKVRLIQPNILKRDIESTLNFLRDAFISLNVDLERKDRPKENIAELAAQICGMAETAGGLFRFNKSRREAVRDVLAEIINTPKEKLIDTAQSIDVVRQDDFQAAIVAKHEIQLKDIIIESLERQIKELKYQTPKKKAWEEYMDKTWRLIKKFVRWPIKSLTKKYGRNDA